MEWIKIKTQHYLFSDMTDKELIALIKIQCLTAHIEAMPTEQQMLKVTHHKTLRTLQERLKEGSRDLQDILKKVLRDVQAVSTERELWKARKQKQRDKEKNVTRDIPAESRDREDKIREDKIRDITPIVPLRGREVDEFISSFLKRWNDFASQYALPQVRGVTPKRRSHLKERFRNKDFVSSVEKVFESIPKSSFLMGKNDRGWKIDFDFLIRNDENYHKILEGKYMDTEMTKIDKGQEILNLVRGKK